LIYLKIMSETAKSENQSYLEPIICDVKTPIDQRVWGQNYQPHRGNVIIDVKESNKIKKLILAAAFYQKIELPYRFALTAGEIIYEKKHIKSVKLAGSYLSGIDALKIQAQLSSRKTQPPPETFLDVDEIVMSEELIIIRAGEWKNQSFTTSDDANSSSATTKSFSPPSSPNGRMTFAN
jgi:hypothetical protein